MLPVAILAGGLATRLRPITETVPKSLIEVAGQPFILRQLSYLREQGIDRVVLCVGYLGEMIETLVGDGLALGMKVAYSADGPTLLGTGGALKGATPLLGEKFFVLYGDSFLPVDYGTVAAAFASSGKAALMTVLRNHDCWDKSNVEFRDGRLVDYDKRAPRPQMSHIDYGLGVLSADIFSAYPDQASFDLADVYHDLAARGQLAGFEVQQRFYEIGSHAGLQETNDYFTRRDTT